MSVKGARASQAERTRKALCRAAQRVFARRGYADASLDEIVRRAGVTKGALYHHFDDKQALYRAVVETMQAGLIGRVRAAAAAQDGPWDRLEAMCRAYLDACRDGDVQQVLVRDAPVVLGWKAWCAIDKEYGIGCFAQALQAVTAAGPAGSAASETLAHVLLGALDSGARVIAAASDPAAAHATVWQSVRRLLAGLGAPDR